MQKWLPLQQRTWRAVIQRRAPCRNRFSTLRDAKHVAVRCASSGEITVSLHNVSRHEAAHPLMIWIPPFSFLDGYDPKLQLPPRWLRKFPTAIINYRWPGFVPDSDSSPATGTNGDEGGPNIPLHWPTAAHDVAFGYKWIVDNLTPPDLARRDIYVFGSYLGASLAASLALTETHTHKPMAVRGLVTYNGIYDWTTLLPDHPIHKIRSSGSTSAKPASLASLLHSINRDLAEPEPEEEDEDPTPFALLHQQAPALFQSPANLFDPFASPSLLFHTPAIHIPPTFDQPLVPATSALSEAVDLLATTPPATDPVPDTDPDTYNDLEPPPRKSHLIFPPRKSTLRIPASLLLFDDFPPRLPRRLSRRPRDGFKPQAGELADLMIRSVELVELRERMQWDHEFEDPEARAAEAEARVRLAGVGADAEGGGEAGLGVFDLNGEGERAVEEWLAERVGY
ncbi:hypothetical protein B0T18DRAFT_448403 [Schizothecium vesticola]|uniref:Alpha/beta-hydrolase n=1 Tax=Schizothecium vesticola TaxID=314040 RepID=A0AA40EQT4_9PEZI|nr:hypothetical protein B0T18DRAFT_448403 [Schizothecium vesticola]